MTQSVKAAILSFTDIDVDKHVAFNQWHRYVHQPEEYSIEGVIAGSRLVATPDLARRRFAIDAALAATQYFGYYLVADPIDETFKAMAVLGQKDLARGRGYDRRGPSVTNRLAHVYSSPNVLSSAEVMPFRPHQGVYVTVDDPTPTGSKQELDAEFAFHEHNVVPDILGIPGVAGCWTFEYPAAFSFPKIPQMAFTVPDRRATRVYWLEGDPTSFLDALQKRTSAARAEARRGYQSVFRSAYRTIPADSKFDWFDK